MQNEVNEKEKKMETTKELWRRQVLHQISKQKNRVGKYRESLPDTLFICSFPSILCSSLNLPILASCHPRCRSHLTKTRTFMCGLPGSPSTFFRTVAIQSSPPASSVSPWILGSPVATQVCSDCSTKSTSPQSLPSFLVHSPSACLSSLSFLPSQHLHLPSTLPSLLRSP